MSITLSLLRRERCFRPLWRRERTRCGRIYTCPPRTTSPIYTKMQCFEYFRLEPTPSTPDNTAASFINHNQRFQPDHRTLRSGKRLEFTTRPDHRPHRPSDGWIFGRHSRSGGLGEFRPQEPDVSLWEQNEEIQISRIHCAVYFAIVNDVAHVRLINYSSRLGTFVNNQLAPSREVIALASGDIIRCGVFNLRITFKSKTSRSFREFFKKLSETHRLPDGPTLAVSEQDRLNAQAWFKGESPLLHAKPLETLESGSFGDVWSRLVSTDRAHPSLFVIKCIRNVLTSTGSEIVILSRTNHV